MNIERIDPCAGCGLPDVLDGPDPAAHWDTPHGSTVVAWSCSPSCASRVEGRRSPDGRLVVPLGCDWYAACGNAATGTLWHPILGDVPICDRCRSVYEALGASS